MAGWSVESWRGFWTDPRPEIAGARVPTIVHPNVEAVWPRSQRLVRGPKAYAQRVIDLLGLVPDLRLELMEHVRGEDAHFIRWTARGTGPQGSFEGIGCDRILLRADLVLSNLVMSDMPIFGTLEAKLAERDRMQ